MQTVNHLINAWTYSITYVKLPIKLWRFTVHYVRTVIDATICFYMLLSKRVVMHYIISGSPDGELCTILISRSCKLIHQYRCFLGTRVLSFSLIACFYHDEVIKWKHFPRYWPFMRGNHRSPVNSLHKVDTPKATTCTNLTERSRNKHTCTISGRILGLHPGKRQTSLQNNAVSHSLGANLESTLLY